MPTLESYDRLPYESFAIPETHPDRLACLAHVLGLEAADPEGCRVLELGAAAGGNLIPIAWHLPGSDCVGVELGAEQARRGQRSIAALGLSNCRLIHGDIAELDGDPDAGLGRFDYILVHGVYSWVPESVREHIFALCGGLLAPHGMAYVSWNVLPGWRSRAMVRDMLLAECAGESDPIVRLGLARGLLERLAEGLSAQGRVDGGRPELELLRREVAYLREARDSYLFHEYLEEINAPEDFATFLARARRHGLDHLADSRLHTLFPSTLGPAAEAVIEPLATREASERMIDCLSLRPFRRSLLVREGRAQIEEIDLERLAGLGLYASLAPVPGEPPGSLQDRGGGRFRVAGALTLAMLAALAEEFPNAVPFDALARAGWARLGHAGEPPADDREAALMECFELYCSGGLGLTRRSARWLTTVEPRPRASLLARVQAEAGEGHAATVRHQTLSLDPLSARLLALLDGRRGRAELLAALSAAAPALAKDGALPSAQSIAANLDRLLDLFARNGLLIPADGPGPG